MNSSVRRVGRSSHCRSSTAITRGPRRASARTTRTAATETAPREPVAPEAGPEDRLLASERGRQIAAAVAQLPERQRDVFTLCQIGGQTAHEVSRALGLSEATVRVHLFRAIRRLRGLLEHERE